MHGIRTGLPGIRYNIFPRRYRWQWRCVHIIYTHYISASQVVTRPENGILAGVNGRVGPVMIIFSCLFSARRPCAVCRFVFGRNLCCAKKQSRNLLSGGRIIRVYTCTYYNIYNIYNGYNSTYIYV